MLRQLVVGVGVSVCNIVIHALVMTILLRPVHAVGKKHTWHPSVLLTAVMTTTVSILMVAHILEVFVWSLAYFIFHAAPTNARLVYFAFVNYTTLGYGDVVPVERWRLLGPMTAMNGILLFGWSTAVIYAILRGTVERTGIIR